MTDYCIACRSGYVSPVLPVSGYMTLYQSGRCVKHMAPVGSYSQNKVFVSSDLGDYYALLNAAVTSGSLEVDASGRKTLIYSPRVCTGMLYQGGQTPVPCTSVSVVLPEFSGFIHGFPSPAASGSRVCSTCGRAVP